MDFTSLWNKFWCAQFVVYFFFLSRQPGTFLLPGSGLAIHDNISWPSLPRNFSCKIFAVKYFQRLFCAQKSSPKICRHILPQKLNISNLGAQILMLRFQCSILNILPDFWTSIWLGYATKTLLSVLSLSNLDKKIWAGPKRLGNFPKWR